jgi:hypothetical protein
MEFSVRTAVETELNEARPGRVCLDVCTLFSKVAWMSDKYISLYGLNFMQIFLLYIHIIN